MSEAVIEKVDNDGMVRLTINRPKALNALNSEVLAALEAHLVELEAQPNLRAVFITGAGEKSFVAGADITEMREKTIKRLETLPVPVVALVNGFCLGGGCELALACDWAVASDNAVFGQPEVLLGVIPGFGGTQRLPRRVGPAMAIDLVTKQLKGNGPQSVRGAKQAVHDGMDQDLDSALALETSLFAFCFAGDEQKEGMAAFVEKRKPNF